MLAEAGTGTGKSVAYLLPAIAYAVQNDTRVVVSTNTINLQDQLFQKDLPDLQRILADAWVRIRRSARRCSRAAATTCARGASWGCWRGRASPRTNCAGRPGCSSGCRARRRATRASYRLPLPSDRFVWTQVAAESAGCSLERCQREMGGRCFFYRARRQAEAAHILVVNHSLLMADAATENRVLPKYNRLILDEAHHLEDAVTDQLSFRADSQTLLHLFTTLSPRGSEGPGRREGGLLADALGALRMARIPPEQYAVVQDHVMRLQADVEGIYLRVDDFWQIVAEAFRDMGVNPQDRGGGADYDLRLRITEATRSQSVWVDIEIAWENLGGQWQTMTKRLDDLRGGLGQLQEAGYRTGQPGGLTEELDVASRELAELHAQMEAWVMKPAGNRVYWVEIGSEERRARRISLHSAPLHVGELVQKHIFDDNYTVIMTSATLRTAGSFDYLRDRLSAHDADTATVGSPFDYKGSTLLYLPTDLPEPNAPGYQTAVEQTVIGLGEGDGRAHAGAVHLVCADEAHRPGHHPRADRGRHHHAHAGQRRLAPSIAGDVQIVAADGAAGHAQLLGGRGRDRVGAQRAGAGAPALRRAERPDRRRAQRDVRRSVLQLPGARCHPALPAGLWPAHPQQDRPRRGAWCSTSASHPRATGGSSWNRCRNAPCSAAR